MLTDYHGRYTEQIVGVGYCSPDCLGIQTPRGEFHNVNNMQTSQ
jgi:hypothetical protein